MSSFFLINTLFVVLISSLSMWLGFWVYLSNRQAKINQIFLLMALLVILWIDSAYFSSFLFQGHFSQILAKIGYGAGTLFLASLYIFFNYFLREEKKIPILHKFIITICFFLSIFSIFSNFIVEEVKITPWGNLPLLGKGRFIFLGIIFLLGWFIIMQILSKYFKITRKEKLKVQYFLVGLFIFIIANLIFNVILPLWQGVPQYYQFGNYSAIFLLGFTAYAIVKRELFGIKVVLTALLVGLIAILLALDLFVFTEKFWLEILKGFILVTFLLFGHYLIKSVQEEVKRREELEKLDKAKSQFISMASHQLRTPLSAIKGYISMLIEGSYGKIPEKAREKLRNIFQSNERLIHLVNDLLNISKIEMGKMEMEKELTQIEELLQSCYEEMKINADKKGLKFIFEKPEYPLPKIEIDSLKIRQVILNLIDNAIRYTQKGEIKLKLEKIDSKIRISVRDTGEGLSQKEQSDIFREFSRGSAGITYFVEGVGLGLYVAKRFLELHGGKIWVESPGKGKGSTFFIELPI